jgi:predicted lipoprotein
MKTPGERSIFDLFLLAICSLASVVAARADIGNRSFLPPAMLSDMAQNCIVPGVIELSTNADALCLATRQLAAEPNGQTLKKAQDAWLKMQLAYKRRQVLCYGPVKDKIFWLPNFYQPLPGKIEFVLHNNIPLNEDQVERMGAALKGLYAMEYLLFSSKSSGTNTVPDRGSSTLLPGTWLLTGDSNLRRRTYLYLMANNLNNHLKIAADTAQAEGFPEKFEAGGRDSVSLLVNQLTVTLETGLIIPLNNFTNQPASVLPQNYHNGAVSGTTIMGMKALLDGLHDFYDGENGFGLRDYVRSVNSGLNNRLEAQFKTTAAALSALKDPQDAMTGAQQGQWKQVLREAHKLEILCKVDLTSALGVTIMFNAYDGD